MRRSCTCETTRSSAYPPIDASLHGITNAGGLPSTATCTSAGEQRASMATIAHTAEENASDPEPMSRREAIRISCEDVRINST